MFVGYITQGFLLEAVSNFYWCQFEVILEIISCHLNADFHILKIAEIEWPQIVAVVWIVKQ